MSIAVNDLPYVLFTISFPVLLIWSDSPFREVMNYKAAGQVSGNEFTIYFKGMCWGGGEGR
jgi:hypothetical protein